MTLLAVLFWISVGMALGCVGLAFCLAIADTRRENAWRHMQGPLKW